MAKNQVSVVTVSLVQAIKSRGCLKWGWCKALTINPRRYMYFSQINLFAAHRMFWFFAQVSKRSHQNAVNLNDGEEAGKKNPFKTKQGINPNTICTHSCQSYI